MNSFSNAASHTGIRRPAASKPPTPLPVRTRKSNSPKVPYEPVKRKVGEEVTNRNVRSRVVPPSKPAVTRAPIATKPTSSFSRSTTSSTRPMTSSRPGIPRPTTSSKPPIIGRPNVRSGSTSSNPPAANDPTQSFDLKQRMMDMEEKLSLMASGQAQEKADNDRLRNDMTSYMEQIEALRQERVVLQTTVQAKSQESTQTAEQVDQLHRDLAQERNAKLQELASLRADHAAELTRMRINHQSEVDTLRQSLEHVNQQHQSLTIAKAAKEAELAEMMNALGRMTSLNSETSAKLRVAQTQLETSQKLERERAEEITKITNEMAAMKKEMEAVIDGLRGEVVGHISRIAECEQQIREDETTRRKLHNAIQELRGNVRVFCRVRPSLGNEGPINGYLEFGDRDNRMIKLTAQGETTSLGKSQMKNYEFNFDRVFPPTSSQSNVFLEISQLVQSALDGYNVCIFAYGQTGSGKTYTMEGQHPIETAPDDAMGMIPRAIVQIFETADMLKDKGWVYSFNTDFLEIYNETLRDLLDSNPNKKLDIKIKKEGSNETYVPDLTRVSVEDPSMVQVLLAKASANRATASTQCNSQSSRSHSIFRLHIIGHNTITQEKISSVLNLIDLAGSERLNQSGVTGDRLTETKAINKSLTNLGSVIQAIANKEQHVPYRNSRLTYLLQPCLGGNSKTLMFVNISPRSDCLNETVNSLRFAAKVNECDIGTARKVVK